LAALPAAAKPRHRLTWRKMMRIAERWLRSPKATAPLSRLAVRRHDPRWGAGAVAPLARSVRGINDLQTAQILVDVTWNSVVGVVARRLRAHDGAPDHHGPPTENLTIRINCLAPDGAGVLVQRQRCVRRARNAPRNRHNPDGLAASEPYSGRPLGPANLASSPAVRCYRGGASRRSLG
jgi:hypothetical protein